MSVVLVYTWLMVMLRSIGLILQMPVVAGHPIPGMVRMAMSLGLASLIAGAVPAAPMPGTMWSFVGSCVMELMLGFGLGFVLRITFAAVDMAGRLISTEIGLTATPGMGAPDPAHEPVAALLSTMAVVLFFLFGAHRGVLTAFAKTFQFAPAGAAAFDPAAGSVMIGATGHLIELAVRIAAPFIAMNFLVNLAFSVLGRAVPKMNVFIVSFSARALFGLGLLSTAGALIARYLYVELGDLPLRILQVMRSG